MNQAEIEEEAAMNPFGLTEPEKQFLALAIQGLTLRQGPAVFTFAISLTEKLCLQEHLKENLQSWIDYSQKK